MRHFERNQQPENIWREFILPFILQFVVLAICLTVHSLVIPLGPTLQEPVLVGDEMTEPTLGRLIFLIFAFFLFLHCARMASRRGRRGEDIVPFWLGVLGGTALWQCMGEDIWHFGVGGTNFIKLESIAVLPLAVMMLLLIIYAGERRSLDWGIWSLLLSFICNWMGHYVMLGTYPFVAAHFEERTWNLLSGSVIGGILLITGIYIAFFASKDRKARLFASMVSYIGIGIIALSIMEG